MIFNTLSFSGQNKFKYFAYLNKILMIHLFYWSRRLFCTCINILLRESIRKYLTLLHYLKCSDIYSLTIAIAVYGTLWNKIPFGTRSTGRPLTRWPVTPLSCYSGADTGQCLRCRDQLDTPACSRYNSSDTWPNSGSRIRHEAVLRKYRTFEMNWHQY